MGRDCLEFNIKVTMPVRWVPCFLGMLNKIQVLGSWGASRQVILYADGDGDLQCEFDWDSDLPQIAKGDELKDGSWLFDAG